MYLPWRVWPMVADALWPDSREWLLLTDIDWPYSILGCDQATGDAIRAAKGVEAVELRSPR